MSFREGQRVRIKPDTPETMAAGLEGEIVLIRTEFSDPVEYVVRVEEYPSPIMGKINTSLSFWADELEPVE